MDCPQGAGFLTSTCGLREGCLIGQFKERPPGGGPAPLSAPAAGVDEPAWAPGPGPVAANLR